MFRLGQVPLSFASNPNSCFLICADLAVGAPYDGDDNRGAVYVFHGSTNGIRIKASQIIFARDIDPSLSTFGYSLSGGFDMDGNVYPGQEVTNTFLCSFRFSQSVLFLHQKCPVTSPGVFAAYTIIYRGNFPKDHLSIKATSLL